jgi:hypothetical protein
MRTVPAAPKAITALHRKLQALLPKDMEGTSSQATAHSRQQASSQVITMPTLQLINKAMRCHILNHLSRLTMDLTAIPPISSSSRTVMAKEVTGNKVTTVDTSMARVAKVVGTRLNW